MGWAEPFDFEANFKLGDRVTFGKSKAEAIVTEVTEHAIRVDFLPEQLKVLITETDGRQRPR